MPDKLKAIISQARQIIEDVILYDEEWPNDDWVDIENSRWILNISKDDFGDFSATLYKKYSDGEVDFDTSVIVYDESGFVEYD